MSEFADESESESESEEKAITKKPRGFAALSPEQRKLVASQGGRASHASGNGHEWSQEAARKAGQLGGRKSRRGQAQPPASEKEDPEKLDRE